MNRLEQRYKEQVVPALMKQFQYSSIMQAPKIEKVVINVGVGDAIANPKAMEEVVAEITDLRSEANRNKGKEIHRELQAA